MRQPTRTTAKNLGNRAALFVAHALAQGEKHNPAFEAFDRMLDKLADDDFFGTEGQCDPRGDRR